MRQVEQQRLPRGRCQGEPAYLREVRYGIIRWPAFVEAIDVVPRRVRRELQQHLLLLKQRLARRAPGHRPQPHEVRQAMPGAFAQAPDDRVDAVIRIAIGVHDGFLLFIPADLRTWALLAEAPCPLIQDFVRAANFPYRDRADFDEAKTELSQCLMSRTVRI
ncbi:hypothetical protein ACFQZT_10375 [Paenibacillus sp. GCM10027628]|uniref:hypothetical protein n=1 Tax=Paenibacillus sp. GCM10027628 TaxID=3273413 RepID=UPI003625BB2F